jgi:hypothetical protein
METRDILIMAHIILVFVVAAVMIIAHADYNKTHNPADLVVEEIAEEVLRLEGIPMVGHEHQKVPEAKVVD